MSRDADANGSHSAEARSQCYGLLAATYNMLPNADFLAMISKTDARAAFSAATQRAPTPHEERESLEAGLLMVEAFQSQMRDANQEELQVRLGVDRARLLRGVKRGYGPPPPYESIYRGGEVVMGDAALGAKGFYTALGYQLPHGCNEPPDYIGLELDFMRFLCQEEAGGWNTQSHGRALECQTWEREFLYKHVVEWVPVFCAEMFADAREDFYRGIAQLTRAFVVLDAEGLRSQDTREH